MCTQQRIKLVLTLCFVVIMVFAFGSTSAAPQKVSAKPIKIGFPIALSGTHGEMGLSALSAASQAVAEWNTRGGCLGRPVELLVQDDKGSVDTSVRIARDFVNSEKVDVLSGALSSAQAVGMSAFAKENKIVYVCPLAATRVLTDKEWNQYTFRISSNTVMRAKGLVVGIAKIQKYKRWATINPDYTWGHTMSEDFIRYYKELVPDMEVVKQFWPPTGETDYTSYIKAIMTSGAEAVQSALTSSDLVTFVSQGKDQGFFDKVVFVNDNAGDVLATYPFGNKYPEGCIGAAFYIPNWKSPENEDFLKRFNKYNGDKKNQWRSPTPLPGFHNLEGYAAINFILSAITKAKTTDTEAVIKAGENLTFNTPVGPVTMRAFDHQMAWPMFVGKTKVLPGYPIVPMVDGLVKVPPNEILSTIEQVVADGHPGRTDLPKEFCTGLGLPK